ncbi:MAG TPA: hypothetical protein VFS24_19530 [Steroidobacteraceae bacterium]|nr:hypothetical protein [Steroidobacteraceae bacterium]
MKSSLATDNHALSPLRLLLGSLVCILLGTMPSQAAWSEDLSAGSLSWSAPADWVQPHTDIQRSTFVHDPDGRGGGE